MPGNSATVVEPPMQTTIDLNITKVEYFPSAFCKMKFIDCLDTSLVETIAVSWLKWRCSGWYCRTAGALSNSGLFLYTRALCHCQRLPAMKYIQLKN